MARKSKSAKNGKKTDTSNDDAKVEIIDAEAVEATESSGDGDGAVIEAEAVDVTTSEEFSPVTSEEEPPLEDAATAAEAGPEDSIGEDASEIDAATDGEGHEDLSSDEAEAPVEELTTEPVAVSPPPPAPAKSSPVPLVFGGLIAGGLGYLASTLVPPPVPDTTEITQSVSAVSDSVAENASALEAVVNDVAALKEAPAPAVDLSGIEGAIAETTSRFDGLEASIESLKQETDQAFTRFDETSNALSDRLTVLETAGPGESEEAEATAEELAAFRAELERLTSEAEQRVSASLEKASEIETAALAAVAEAEEAAALAEQEAAEAAALAEQQAAEAAAQAEREAAIAALKTALESGAGYEDHVAVIGDVPEVLSQNAESGITPLVDLQQSFASAARTALSSAETIPQDASASQRFTAFLKQRTNARSLTPKEGDGLDAVLSRAEAFLKQGDLAGSLVELEALGEDAKVAMQGWLDQATTRQAAVEAADQLSATN